jgi:hypothetical protein
MNDKVIKHMISAKPEGKPLFVVGQTVRVISNIEVNFPPSLNHWLNSKCIVLNVVTRGLISKEYVYELLHPNGRICEFKAEELDRRYSRKA